MSDKDFYQVFIESVEPDYSFFQTFWRAAAHPGEAVDSVLDACVSMGIKNPIARNLDLFASLPKDLVRNRKWNVYYDPVRYGFPTEPTSFIAPFGIIEAGKKGKYDYDVIREGFVLEKTRQGIYEVEAAIERHNLVNVFFALIDRLPSIRVFWIRMAADWENRGLEQLWTNEALKTPAKIKRYLTNNYQDTIANGHVALTVYGDPGQTNLLIDTHKTIKVLTKSGAIQRRMAAALRRLGIEQLSEFHSLEYSFHHWHYRPLRSKSRTRLVSALKKDGFTLWRSIERRKED